MNDAEVSHIRELLKHAASERDTAERACAVFAANEEKVLSLCQQAGVEVGSSSVSAVAALVEQHAQVGVQMVAAVENERLARATIAVLRAHVSALRDT